MIMPYYRFAVRDVFYKECVIVGQEHIPPPGTPIFIAANHQNSLNDGLTMVCMFKDFRQPVSLARGDFFNNKVLAKFFRFWRVMPTYRASDGSKADIKKNLETFEIASKILQNGGVIMMFPEAMHQQRRILGTFKKGVPRVCFAAEESSDFQLHLQVLPVNLHYSHIQQFRQKALIEIGKPFDISEFFETYKNNPNEAYLQFNQKTRAILKTMVLDIEDVEHYEEYNLLREVIRYDIICRNYKKYNYYDEFKEEKRVIDDIDRLKANFPEKFENLMTQTKKYSTGLQKLNFRNWLINSKISGLGLVAKYLLMILLLPFFLFGCVNNALPCALTNYITGKMKDKVFIGSVRLFLGFMLFPFYYLGICIAASLISHSFTVGISYTVLAFLSLFVYYRYRVILLKLWHTVRYFFKRKTDEVQQLMALKEDILRYF
jgi:1-acyl-sn-glycerol-3-phosphate acyltransferase